MKAHRVVSVALILALGAGTGCYHYVPVQVAAHPQGTPLRTRLSRMQSFELYQITVNNIDQVEGEMVQLDGSDLVLSATWLQAVTGNGYPGNGWTVRIPQVDVTGMEQKRFSWWRSGVVFAAVALGTTLGFEAMGVNIYRGGGSGGGGGQQQ
jgi:hypothetical protein